MDSSRRGEYGTNTIAAKRNLSHILSCFYHTRFTPHVLKNNIFSLFLIRSNCIKGIAKSYTYDDDDDDYDDDYVDLSCGSATLKSENDFTPTNGVNNAINWEKQ